MDYYNFNPNDSLDFLYQPTQSHCDNVSRGYPECSLPDNSFLRADPTCAWYPRPTLSSSDSLILKKTTERELQQHSDINQNRKYSNYINSIPYKLDKDSKTRPTIKVTVIPNSTQSKLRKRRSSVNKIQSSVSNQENSIQANNVYLVITGKNREKVYELRTTGSADFSSGHKRYVKDEEVIVEENIKQLLSSLNMDKKKKSKKKKEVYVEEASDSSATHTDGLERVKLDDCLCNDSLKVRKSRVRITGKIGLTDNDRYVLRCAATVDGKPVETNFTEDQNYASYPIPPNPWECPVRDLCNKRISYNSYNTQTRTIEENRNQVQQREVNVQVSLDTDDKNKMCNRCPFIVIPCKGYRSVETQCTPANFNSVCFSNIDQLKIMSTNTDQMIQCSCPSPNIGNMQMGTENEKFIAPKSCQSPLVIISVYPKAESEMNNEASPSKSQSPRRNKRGSGTRDKSPKSRSPSPAQGRSKNKIEAKNKSEAKNKKTKGKDSVSGGEVTTVSTKSSRKEKVIQQTKLQSSNKKNTKEADVQANLDESSSSRQKGMTGRKPGQLDTHELTARTSSKLARVKPSANETTSKYTTINIDNERDRYDVLLNQAGIAIESFSSFEDRDSHSVETDSLENFLLVSDTQRKRSFSETFLLDDKSNGNLDLDSEKFLPRLAVRDSLEVSHRREEKNSIQLKSPESETSFQPSTEHKNKNDAASVKHYRGDCCELFNPVERDKEIRQLLGIQKITQTKPEDIQDTIFNAQEECSLHCFFHANRNSNLTSQALYNRFPRIYMTSKSSICECEETDSSTDIIGDNYNDDDVCKVCTDSLDETDMSNEEINKPVMTANDHQRDQKKKLAYWNKNENNCNKQTNEYTNENHDYKNCKKILCQGPSKGDHPLYQQLILNRNVNIYLQIEQFTKQKPIVLSRKQYNKVKRTIESASLRSKTHSVCKKSSIFTEKKNPRSQPDTSEKNIEIKKSTTRPTAPSIITKTIDKQTSKENSKYRLKIKDSKQRIYKKKNTSVGDGDAFITKRTICTETKKCQENYPKSIKSPAKSEDNLDHEVFTPLKKNNSKTVQQLDQPDLKETVQCLCKKHEKKSRLEKLNKQQYVRPKSENRKNRKLIMKDQQQYVREKSNSESEVKLSSQSLNKRVGQGEAVCSPNCRDDCSNPDYSHFCTKCGQLTKNYNFLCTVCQNLKGPVVTESKDFGRSQVATRHTTSSTDVHFTSITLTKRVTFSSTNFIENERKPSVANVLLKNYNSDSLHTIFKGHKKTATPNLGTSAYSLYSDSDKSSNTKIVEPDPRPRKPFLRRLMSCLVLRSRTSDIKVAAAPIPKIPSANSSVDSYHISTSLGGIELSSSIYDTSVSFFSSHSIQPISSKIKRGFLSSVREFLTNRRN